MRRGRHSGAVKRKDVMFIIYNAEDEPEHDSDEHPDPDTVNVKDETEDFLLHCTLSTISIHKTEEDLLKEQEAWGACKKCNKSAKIELMHKEGKFDDQRSNHEKEAVSEPIRVQSRRLDLFKHIASLRAHKKTSEELLHHEVGESHHELANEAKSSSIGK